MIRFINKNQSQKSPERPIDYECLDGSFSIGVLIELLKHPKVFIRDAPRCFSITNRGGQRLVNFIRTIMSSTNDVIVVFDPLYLKELVDEVPQNLYQFSESSRNQLIEQLLDNDVAEYEVVEGVLKPVRFVNSQSLFNWVLKSDPVLSVDMFNQIRKAKSENKDLLNKDFLVFDEYLPSAKLISNKYGIDKQEVIKSFINYSA